MAVHAENRLKRSVVELAKMYQLSVHSELMNYSSNIIESAALDFHLHFCCGLLNDLSFSNIQSTICFYFVFSCLALGTRSPLCQRCEWRHSNRWRHHFGANRTSSNRRPSIVRHRIIRKYWSTWEPSWLNVGRPSSPFPWHPHPAIQGTKGLNWRDAAITWRRWVNCFIYIYSFAVICNCVALVHMYIPSIVTSTKCIQR